MDHKISIRRNRCAQFLSKAPNLPTSVLKILFGYYTRFPPHKDAVEAVIELSVDQRLSLKSLQKDFPFIITGISNPNCINQTEILESLVQIGISVYSAPIYVLAKFSLPYVLNPVKSLREFVDDLKMAAATDIFLTDVLSFGVEFSGDYIPLQKFFSTFDDSTQIFTVLFNISFDSEPSAFKYFFHELEKIYYYPGMELSSYRVYFKSDESFKIFLKDLWAAKHKGQLGFAEIFKHFNAEDRVSLTDSLDYKRNFIRWLNFFNVFFKESIIDEVKIKVL